MKIETWSLDKLKPANYNPRRITPDALKGLQESIDRFGIVEPIIVNEKTGNIVGGHQRYEVLKKLNQKECLVVIVDLDEKDEHALNITLNNQSIQGEFTEVLQEQLTELKEKISYFDDIGLNELVQEEIIIPNDNKDIDEKEMENTENECPECGFKW